jgi:hypothetical protein
MPTSIRHLLFSKTAYFEFHRFLWSHQQVKPSPRNVLATRLRDQRVCPLEVSFLLKSSADWPPHLTYGLLSHRVYFRVFTSDLIGTWFGW